MLPTIQLFGRTITMYGVMIILGFIVGIALMVLRSKRYNMKPEDALFAALFGGIGLFIGAKLLFVLLSVPELIKYRQLFLDKPSLFYHFIMSGYIFYGGLIGAIISIYLYCYKFKVNHRSMFDLAAPSIPIIHGLGRIGCFFAGCCYGIPYQGFGHIQFEHSIAAPNLVPLFPVQLLESGINLLAGAFLLIYASKQRRSGRVLGIYLTYYAILRFLMEFLRGDIERGLFFGVSTSQWISLILLPIGLWFLFLPKEDMNKS